MNVPSMNAGNRARIRVLPVFAAALIALAGLKAAGLWISFSSAAAEAPIENSVQQERPVDHAAAATSPTGVRLLDQLGAREAELNQREAELDTRAKVLQAAEQRLETSIRALKAEKEQLAFADDARKRQRNDEIGALSSAYERMKPADAARIFNDLDDDILIPIAAGMRTQSIAGVLANLSPEKARALTIALANRESAAAPATVKPAAATPDAAPVEKAPAP